ncbi:MAG TPA: hypothetical protein VHC95_10695 [Opitutales bacterium]|nr:hypothetical protein [Opitutales bacterium]
MSSLLHQRCFNHASREAVARCPSCGHFFCRECITEHDDRVICAACLVKITQAAPARRRVLAALRRGACAALGVLVAWFFFYALAQVLLQTPTPTHSSATYQSR